MHYSVLYDLRNVKSLQKYLQSLERLENSLEDSVKATPVQYFICRVQSECYNLTQRRSLLAWNLTDNTSENAKAVCCNQWLFRPWVINIQPSSTCQPNNVLNFAHKLFLNAPKFLADIEDIYVLSLNLTVS